MQKTFTRKFTLKLRIQFWHLGDFFCENWSKKKSLCPKKKKKQNCSSLKCYLGHVEFSSNNPVDKLEKKPETSSSVFENDEKFHLFSKRVFFKMILQIRRMQFWQAGQTFPAQLPEMIWKKVHKKCKNFSKNLLQEVTKER